MLYVSQTLTEPHLFTSGIEGPACDKQGNVYAVNYARRHTIGKVTPEGVSRLFLELPAGATGNAIRFHRGDMFIADYTGHRILRVDMQTLQIDTFAEQPAMNQPNDIAVTKNGMWFASDPNWKQSSGMLWRIAQNGISTLLEAEMGTTNGIEVNYDERSLYVNETVQRRIWQYDLIGGSDICNKRLFHEFADYGLDGMRCDIEGNLYVTRYGKGTIAVLSPQGELLREVALNGKLCTNVTFGGADGRTCYVTMADAGTIESFRTETPGRCWALWNDNDERSVES
ncbi:SMP-30/gluconolactonase/LRE family protein [Paenibacillus sp. 5J-6]|uniref:SMP-30/gluconolactonase/LRE family protein n=1 Tax=Paenibacillus silvestris TaxID=2606219 RepID=A0A6L8UU42_9BACL|nr:SMP-30/gluconolactonase/LRE family protein [Paenibacillus silvestris]MZQ81394.1 SMP-30/gluconolactonase/LRE family protein [Paenibacillus silvestris]